jgi:excisionase family DNA binding protein
MESSHQIPKNAEYISIREAAKIIGCSPKRAYQYVTEGRLPAQRVGNMFIVPLEAVKAFQRAPSGRLRTKPQQWRTYQGSIRLFATIIQAQIDAGKREQLLQKFKDLPADQNIFTGTMARYVTGDADSVEILLIWKEQEMPDDETRQQDLRSFQQAFPELQWKTAQYRSQDVFLHT